MSGTREPEETYADEPECPVCHRMIGDAWEFADEADYECDCGAELTITRDISVSYTTRVAPVK